jgi:glutaminyl-peptide cyclotransferase
MYRPRLTFRSDGLGGRLLALLVLTLLASCGACGGGATSPPVVVPAFDEARAFADLQHQCDFGPRSPGSTGHTQQLAWMKEQLTPLAGRIVSQPFQTSTPMGGPYDFENVIAVFGEALPGTATMVMAHWDTRPVADADPLAENKTKPVPGANDGASGVGVLMELARMLQAEPAPHPVYLCFLDAEDSGLASGPQPYYGFCLGSQHLAANWPAGLAQPDQVILLDLVGGVAKHNDRLGNPRGSVDYLDLPKEANSVAQAGALVNAIWAAAAQVGAAAFRSAPGQETIDDHMPFLAVGIPAVDIIQTPFPPVWHTIDDTPEYCSAGALGQVGDTLAAFLWGN